MNDNAHIGKDSITQKKHASMFSPLVVDGFAAITSIGAGAAVAWREILSESYANFTALDLADDIKTKYRKHFGPELSRQIEAGLDKDVAIERILKQNNEYNAAMAARMEKSGFGTLGNRLKLLNNHERWKIALTSLAITGVALGSLLMLSKEAFADKVQQNEPDQDLQR